MLVVILLYIGVIVKGESKKDDVNSAEQVGTVVDRPLLKPQQRVADLFAKKNLSYDRLINDQAMAWSDPLSAHAERAFNAIYSKPYRGSVESPQEIARSLHGIQHATRVSLYSPWPRQLI